MDAAATEVNRRCEDRAFRVKRTASGYLELDGRKINHSFSIGSDVRDCPRKAWYRKIGGVRENSESAQRGTRIHALLETFGKTGEWPTPAFKINVDGEMQSPTTLDFALAQEAERYVVRAPGVTHEQFARIDRFLDGDVRADLVAKIDVLDRSGAVAEVYREVRGCGLMSAGEPGIVDYKTRSNMDYAPDAESLRNDPQMLLYAIAAFRGGVPDYFNVAHVNINTKKITVEPRGACTTRAKAEGIAKREAEHAKRVFEVLQIRKVEDVPAVKASCDKYGGCPFKGICPSSVQNNAPVGRLGTPRGIFTRKSEQPKKEPIMALDLKAAAAARRAEKAAQAAAPPKTSTPKPPAASSKPAPGTPRPAPKPPGAEKRTVAADAGPSKDAKGTPVVTQAMITDLKRTVRAVCRENDLEPSEKIIRAACEEIGLDFAAAFDMIAAIYDDVEFGAAEDAEDADEDAEDADEDAEDADEDAEDADEDAEDADEDAEDAEEDAEDAEEDADEDAEDDAEGWVWEPLQAYPYTQGIHEVNEVALSEDAAAAAFLLLLLEITKDGPVSVKDAMTQGKIAYNTCRDKYPDLDYTHSKEIQRIKLPRLLEIINLAPSLIGYDADAETVYRVDDVVSDAQDTPEAPEPPAATQAAKTLVSETPTAPKAPESVRVTSTPDADAATRVVCVGCRPVGVEGGVMEFADWIRPILTQVENENGVPFWNAIEFSKGPGLVGQAVARGMARGEISLPPYLVADRFHPAWNPVRDVLSLYEIAWFVGSN